MLSLGGDLGRLPSAFHHSSFILLPSPQCGFRVALGSHWSGFKVALGWLWGAYQLAINRLWGGFDVALMSH
jgi:hypothetical protein